MSAIRLDFTNDSRSRSSRSWTAQIAGYRVLLTKSSTRVVNAVMFAASATAPTPASPSFALAAMVIALASTTFEAVAMNSGPE